ncbi:hypothetical protein [Winogradskyella vincentii]|uniref:Uncharacterized protein n=1 Tax=Winogradskyella vincentii TaxID=2877122 RepID=A0ABS7XYP4_9FLAO|nr:hypothetical protein [Winogradskyella vincentii]MCA0152225.1 hypothetical protein [Winogradskyella vincentii]
MGTLNQDFKYPKSFQLFVGLVFILFLIMFVYTISLVIGVFDIELYSPAVAGISPEGNY